VLPAGVDVVDEGCRQAASPQTSPATVRRTSALVSEG
jgi:hypothetical protein